MIRTAQKSFSNEPTNKFLRKVWKMLHYCIYAKFANELYDEVYTSPEDCPSNNIHRRGLSCLSQCMLRRRYRCCYGGPLSSKTSAAFCQEFRTLLKYIQTPQGPFKNYVTLTDLWVSLTLCDNGWGGVPRALRRFKFFNPLIVCFPLQKLDTKHT